MDDVLRHRVQPVLAGDQLIALAQHFAELFLLIVVQLGVLNRLINRAENWVVEKCLISFRIVRENLRLIHLGQNRSDVAFQVRLRDNLIFGKVDRVYEGHWNSTVCNK